MENQTLISQYESLKTKLIEWAFQYYVEDKPTVEDSVYDASYDILKQIEIENPWIIAIDSPTQVIVAKKRSDFDTIEHTTSMLSIDNAMDLDSAKKYYSNCTQSLGVADVEHISEPKYDGLSMSLKYKVDHEKKVIKYFQAVTRGDGISGEDVTAQVAMIRNIPKFLDYSKICTGDKAMVEIRGEVLMPRSVFEHLNKTRTDPFSNCRAAAAGSVRQLDPNVTRERQLVFYAYTLIDASEYGMESQTQAIELLKDLGFTVSDKIKICKNFEEIQACFEAFGRERENLDFDTDGNVFKVNNFKFQSKLGWIAKVPKWAIAYKYPAQKCNTVVESIVVQIGRTGAVTPVAKVTPVYVGGVIVSSINLHNMDEIHRLGLKIGDTVAVYRAGEVIPDISSVVSTTDASVEFEMPNICPECGSPIVRQQDEAKYYCTGSTICPAQVVNSMAYFCERANMNIDGLSEKTIEKLYQAKMLNKLEDLIVLQKYLPQIETIPGFGKKSAENIVTAIEAARNSRSLAKFITSLGIRTVGESTALELVKKFGTFENLSIATHQELLAVKDIGKVTANSIVEYFSNASNLKEATALLDYFNPTVLVIDENTQKFKGLTFVITGTLSKSRSHYEETIQNLGGTVSGSVSKKTSYVLAGAEAGTKLEKAKTLGIVVLDEQQFENMCN